MISQFDFGIKNREESGNLSLSGNKYFPYNLCNELVLRLHRLAYSPCGHSHNNLSAST